MDRKAYKHNETYLSVAGFWSKTFYTACPLDTCSLEPKHVVEWTIGCY
jgi:hypothetical protein